MKYHSLFSIRTFVIVAIVCCFVTLGCEHRTKRIQRGMEDVNRHADDIENEIP